MNQNSFLFNRDIQPKQKVTLWGAFKVALKCWGTYGKDFELVIREPENQGAFRGFWVLIDKARSYMNGEGNNFTKEQVYEYFKKEANFVETINGVIITRSLKRTEGCTYEDLINLIQFIEKWAADLGLVGICLDSKADQEFRKYFKIKEDNV